MKYLLLCLVLFCADEAFLRLKMQMEIEYAERRRFDKKNKKEKQIYGISL